MNRILGIDPGDQRMGLAISDETRTLASPFGVYECQDVDTDLSYVAEVVAREHISEIVLGLPVNMDGSLGARAQETFQFQRLLADKLKVPVHTFDERLTTAEAERVLLEANMSRQKRGNIRDALAAVLILQGYLDSQC